MEGLKGRWREGEEISLVGRAGPSTMEGRRGDQPLPVHPPSLVGRAGPPTFLVYMEGRRGGWRAGEEISLVGRAGPPTFLVWVEGRRGDQPLPVHPPSWWGEQVYPPSWCRWREGEEISLSRPTHLPGVDGGKERGSPLVGRAGPPTFGGRGRWREGEEISLKGRADPPTFLV